MAKGHLLFACATAYCLAAFAAWDQCGGEDVYQQNCYGKRRMTDSRVLASRGVSNESAIS